MTVFSDMILADIESISKVIEYLSKYYGDINKQENIKKKIDELLGYTLEKVNEIILIGAGSSCSSAKFGSYLIEEYADIHCEAYTPLDFIYAGGSASLVSKNTLMIAISKSGATSDIIEVVTMAKNMGLTVFGLTGQAEENKLEKIADIVFYINSAEGDEIDKHNGIFSIGG